MREIKFRLWDSVSLRMYDGAPLYWDMSKFVTGVWDFHETHVVEVKDWNPVVMQYTGLKDKNGQEIYEGDVVKIHNYKTTWKNGEPEIDWRVFEVMHVRYTYTFNNSLISIPFGDYDTDDLNPWDIEVIGNIYENPELIDGQRG